MYTVQSVHKSFEHIWVLTHAINRTYGFTAAKPLLSLQFAAAAPADMPQAAARLLAVRPTAYMNASLYGTGLWRSDWENDLTNKLQWIGASVDTLRPMRKSRREETSLTVSSPHRPQSCDSCTLVAWAWWPTSSLQILSISIRHLLITCPCYVPIRSRHYRSNNLTHLLTHVQPSRIFSFLTEIKFYDKMWLFYL